MNLSIADIAKAANGEIINNNNIIIKNITKDSRKVLSDSLYWSIQGEIFDGHDFIFEAVENGALGVVAREEAVKRFDLQSRNMTVIAVKDTVQALLDFAKYYKNLHKNLDKLDKIIAVTGSVGKTTAKEFMYSVLSEKFKTQKSGGNFNNEIGMPFTLFELEKDTEAVVLEMGMSGFGEIKRLSESANPDMAVITNIGTSHISNLGSREGIKKAKFEILDGMAYDSDIILNADDNMLYSERNKTERKEYFFGINNEEADFIAEEIEFDYNKNISAFTVDKIKFKIPAAGTHNIYNALPALIAGKIYGLSNEEIQGGFNNFENAKMRQNIYALNDITNIIIIDDCYNASLESVKAAVETLANINKSKKIAVLSDVLESGSFSGEIHRKIGEDLLYKKIDKVYLFGENSKITYETVKQGGGECVYFEDKSEIASELFRELKELRECAVLFKASRGMAMETVLEDLKKNMR